MGTSSSPISARSRRCSSGSRRRPRWRDSGHPRSSSSSRSGASGRSPRPSTAVAQRKPLVIDESDAGLDAFPRARELGYAGVSAKSCKGVYRALLNAARASAWNSAEAPCFITAEDLTTQPGVCLQQSLAIAALVGATHAELNGHHYVGGFPGAPAEEQARFAQAHADLYETGESGARLRIRDGRIAIASLDAAGFATACQPAWDSMREI